MMEEMTGHRRVAKNSALYFFSKGIDILCGIAVLALVTRYLGDYSYGKYAFVMNLVLLFVPAINFGLSGIVIREIARNRDKSDEIFGTAMSIRTIFVILSIPAIIIIAYQFSGISMIMVELAMISEFALGYSRLNSDLFVGHERMAYDFLMTIVNKLMLVSAISLVVYYDLNLIGVFTGIAAVNLMTAVFGFGVAWRKFHRVRIIFEAKSLKFLLRAAYPLAFSFLLSETLFRLDIFILKMFGNYSEIAFFDAPLRLILRFSSLALAFVTSLHPVYCRLANTSRTDLLYIYEKSIKALLAFILPVCLFTAFFAKPISVIIFGARFVEAADSLQFLIWVLFILFFDILSGHILIALNKQKLIAVEFVVCFIINLVMEIILVPRYGHIGASCSKLVAFGIAFLLLLYFVYRELGPVSIFMISNKPLISSLLMITALWFVKDHGLLFPLLVGVPTYMGALYGLKIFPHKEVLRLKKILKTA